MSTYTEAVYKDDKTKDAAGIERLRESVYKRRIAAGDSKETAERFTTLYAGEKPREPTNGRGRLFETQTRRYVAQGRSEDVAKRLATLFCEAER